MKGSELLLGIIKSCSDALAYVNKRVEDVYKLYSTLQNNYDQNVVIRNPQNGIATQNITMGLTFGLSDSTFANIPTYTFTVGSKLRYARILPFNQTDGLEVVNFTTLQNYMNEMIGLTTAEALPSYAGLPEGYFLDLQGSPVTPTWMPFPTILPPYDPVNDVGKSLTIVSGGLDWMLPIQASSGDNSLSISAHFDWTCPAFNPTWSNTVSNVVISYLGSGNILIIPDAGVCYQNYLKFAVTETGVYSLLLGATVRLYDGLPPTNEIVLLNSRATLEVGHTYYVGGMTITYTTIEQTDGHGNVYSHNTGFGPGSCILNTITIIKVA